MHYRVTVDYQFVCVDPVPGDLLPLLTVSEQVPTSAANGSVHVQSQAEEYYAVSGGRLVTFAGLEQRVVAGLRHSGHELELIDGRLDSLACAAHPNWYEALRDMPCTRNLVPDLAGFEQLDPADRELLTAAAAATRGRLVVPDISNVPRLLALICVLFPKARILIPADSRRKVLALQQQLERRLDEPVQAVFGRECDYRYRVAVCNLASFEHMNLAFWNIVLYPSHREAIHRISIDTIAPYLGEYRVYCFVDRNARLNTRDTLRLEAAAGGVVHHVPVRPEARPVRVFLTHAPGLPTSPQYGKADKPTAYQRKRHRFWANDARNDALADIARAAAAGDMAALWEHGLMLGEQDWFQRHDRHLSVVIMAEVMEHARQLQQRLPSWSIACKVPGSIEQQRQAGQHADWQQARLDRCIVTSVYAEQIGINADVVIRADGTAARWNLNCGPFSDAAGMPLAIIDLLDDADEQAQQDTLRRILDYQRRGWPVAGKPANLPGPYTHGEQERGHGKQEHGKGNGNTGNGNDTRNPWQTGNGKPDEEVLVMNNPRHDG